MIRARPFRPAAWLPGSHAQTIVGRALRRKRGITFRRECVDTPDDDFVHLDFAEVAGHAWRALGDKAPVALLLHGMEGSSRSGYAYETYRNLAAVGVRPVGMSFRSCSGVMNRQPRLYHSGDTGDAAHVIDLLRQRFPDVKLGAVGFSLGGNVLLKYLSERGAGGPLAAAVAVSVPYDLAACARRVHEGASRIYGWFLLRKLRNKVLVRREALAGRCDVGQGLVARTFREFDEAVTAPLHGFDDAADYYARCSSGRLLGGIGTPTLLLHALDDPFIPREALPHAAMRANPALRPEIAERGGHVGFVTGPAPWSRTFWAEREAALYLSRMLRG